MLRNKIRLHSLVTDLSSERRLKICQEKENFNLDIKYYLPLNKTTALYHQLYRAGAVQAELQGQRGRMGAEQYQQERIFIDAFDVNI